ncbi:MAG: succinyl-diaminopimelate desuccinylase [Actinobacteria bacterium]|nr:succinyl-diaminopimelate desuccinylase [Actinomycetota bacterium]
MRDLLALTAELVDIASPSGGEDALADHVERVLRQVPWLQVERLGDNVVARTDLARSQRLILAGHLDTVPAQGNESARLEGDTLWGLGAADMKAGLAVFLDLATTVADPAVDVTYVFYTCEEVEQDRSGLGRLFAERPALLVGDAAILGEPTDGAVEAGCQGSLRLAITLMGRRAHTARPWMGVNAIHRLGRLLAVIDEWEGRRPVLDGCEFREAIQAVGVEAGVAGNVVPDRATVTLNHRFAPDRSAEVALAHLRELLGDIVGPEDEVTVLDQVDGAPPGLDHPLLAALVNGGDGDADGLEVRSKLGWTDVARFAAHGIPACNFGPGDPTLAHAPDERVGRAALVAVHGALRSLLELGAP